MVPLPGPGALDYHPATDADATVNPSSADGGAPMSVLIRTALVVLLLTGLAVPLTWTAADAQERVIKIAGVGAMTGVIRGFGINSKAVMDMTVDELNAAGGFKLA